MPNRILAAAWAPMLSLAVSATAVAAELKPRIIVLTDITPITCEPDDMESLVRLLAHADLFEIEALVATTGWSTNDKVYPELIHDVIAAYEKDLPNLRKRSKQAGHRAGESRQEIGYWPSPEYLRSRTVVGSTRMGNAVIGADNKSAGSELIIKIADETDPRPIYVGAWGGANTLSQAIWTVKQTRTPEEFRAFLRKLRVYTITDQDKPMGEVPYDFSSHSWMRREFSKDLLFIWDESAWPFQNDTGRSNWAQYAALIQNHGSLGTIYPEYKYGVEGDTPSYLYVWPNGLNDPEHPGYGGWGATFEFGVTEDKVTSAYHNHAGTAARETSRKFAARFYPAEFNSFVSRMAWAKDGNGNRNPVAVVNGDATLAAMKLAPVAGASVTLDAAGSTDPDGDALTYSWWVFTGAGTYTGEIAMSGADSSAVTVRVPADAGGKSFHLICEITDSGSPPLTAYRRIIVEPPK